MFHISATWCTVLVGHSCLKMNCVKSNLILVLRFFPTVKQFAVCQMGRNMMTHAQSEVPMWTAYEGITLSTTWFLPQEATACCEEYIDPFMTVLVADARANILDSRDTPGPQDVSCPSKWYLDIPRLAFIWKTFWAIISNWFYAFNIVCISANNANSSSFSMFFSRNFASERRATHVMFNQQVVAHFICKNSLSCHKCFERFTLTLTRIHMHLPHWLVCRNEIHGLSNFAVEDTGSLCRSAAVCIHSATMPQVYLNVSLEDMERSCVPQLWRDRDTASNVVRQPLGFVLKCWSGALFPQHQMESRSLFQRES